MWQRECASDNNDRTIAQERFVVCGVFFLVLLDPDVSTINFP